MRFSAFELEKLIDSDLPFNDLTTELIGHSGAAKLDIIARDEITLSCIDAVKDICAMRAVDGGSEFTNGQSARKGDVIFSANGEFGALHEIYKSVQNLLEHACGIATLANSMLRAAKAVNEKCEILVTRKSFPFAKKLCLKAALEGGANIHRTGLSDSILFFENHLVAYDNSSDFLRDIAKFKAKFVERKIIAECADIGFARELLRAGIDGVQCDKMSPQALKDVLLARDELAPRAIVLAAGGITPANVGQFAIADAVVTSYVFRGIANLGAKISL